MLLKLKAKIYQYTGIYLVKKEESEYMASEQAKLDMKELLAGTGYSKILGKGLTVALWQGKNGFASIHTGIWVPSHKPWYKIAYYATLNRIKTIYLQLKMDIGS